MDIDDQRRPMDRPPWVKLGLWGLGSRTSAWVFFWLSIAVAVACVAYGFTDWRFFLGGLMVFAALWYYLAIRWVDRYGTWE